MSHNPKILVIDDDTRLLRFLELNLDAAGYRVLLADTGRAGFNMLLTYQPDVVILDCMLPDTDGLQLCEQIREFSDVPIVILTARRGENELVQGLDVGADDYVMKPFGREELLARVRAVLRRANQAPCDNEPMTIVLGDLVLNCAEKCVVRGGQRTRLSSTEFRLLYFLMSNPNRLLVNDDLIARVWGPEFVGDTENLRTYIRYLRQKIESEPKAPTRIVTERGIGYRFIDPI